MVSPKAGNRTAQRKRSPITKGDFEKIIQKKASLFDINKIGNDSDEGKARKMTEKIETPVQSFKNKKDFIKMNKQKVAGGISEYAKQLRQTGTGILERFKNSNLEVEDFERVEEGGGGGGISPLHEPGIKLSPISQHQSMAPDQMKSIDSILGKSGGKSQKPLPPGKSYYSSCYLNHSSQSKGNR